MKLNLPIEMADRNVLLVGAGGGWDVLGALPLAHELRQTCRVVLANYSSSVGGFAVRPATPDDHPEGKLAENLGEPIHVLGKMGARTLREGYEQIIQQNGIDTIILVDGGVDSLMRGDEEGPGSILQDTLSLVVVSGLDVPTKILACIGFGTETEEGVCHYRVLENMAALTEEGCFLGACALTQEMEAFRYYERLCRAAFDQDAVRSHIHTRIIPAVQGKFGRYEMYDDANQPLDLLSDRPPFVNPLMSLYWFFEAAGVARRSLLAPHLAETVTWEDVQAAYNEVYPILRAKVRKNRGIPL